MNALEIRGLTKSFPSRRGAIEVLGGVDLSVGEGEFASIVGPSGSGKSTLFSLIGGLERPDAGDIRVNGEPAGQAQAGARARAAYMPQQASLMPWRTVQGNIELALRISGRSRAEARELTGNGWSGSARSGMPAPIPMCCREACSSGFPSCGHSCRRSRSCCWTSRSARSTR